MSDQKRDRTQENVPLLEVVAPSQVPGTYWRTSREGSPLGSPFLGEGPVVRVNLLESKRRFKS